MMHNFAVDIELVWDELFNESVHKIIDKKVRAISAFSALHSARQLGERRVEHEKLIWLSRWINEWTLIEIFFLPFRLRFFLLARFMLVTDSLYQRQR